MNVRAAILIGVVVVTGLLVTFVGGNSAAPAASHAANTPWHLVALGDSIPQPSACPGCTTFVDLYAGAIKKATGRPVVVDNRAANQLSNVPPVQVATVKSHLLTDASLRTAIAGADIVLVNVGINDMPWSRFDDPCDVAPNFPVVKWRQLSPVCSRRVTSEYKKTLDEVLTQIDELRGCGGQVDVPPCSQRGQKDTLVRVVTVYNSAIGDTVDPGWNSPESARRTRFANDLFAHAQCEVVRFHGGRCADVYHAMNGRRGTRAAGRYFAGDYTHLNQEGHRLVARTLANLGYAPLVP